MNIAWLVGNSPDFRETPESMGTFEAFILFVIVLVGISICGLTELVATLFSRRPSVR
jgi:hypothetical protein